MMNFILILLSTNLLFAADVQKYQPVETLINPGDRIVIRGFKGNVTVEESVGDALVVQGMRPKNNTDFDQWNFKMAKSPGVVEIAVKGGSDSEDWEKIRAGQLPNFSLIVKSPSRPLEISWTEGKIQLNNWKSQVTINSTKGSIISKGGGGALFAQMINGRIQVTSHEGSLNFQTHKGDVLVSKSKGPVTIDNHSATYKFVEHLGGATISNFQGGLTFSKVSGQMNFNNVNGTITAAKYKGSVKGDTKKGQVSIKADQIQDFNVNSDTGVVVLDLPKTAGANVSIRSDKGRLHAPSHFIKRRRGRWTELRGKFKGKEPGQVKIVSKYGDIVVK